MPDQKLIGSEFAKFQGFEGADDGRQSSLYIGVIALAKVVN